MNKEEYIKKIDEKIESLCEELEDITPTELKVIVDEFKKFALRPGKRIRPLLLLLSYEGYDGTDIEDALLLASSLELMHSFLLVHDDIIDNSDLRRGEPTLHKIYEKVYNLPKLGVDVSIVIGDIIAFFVFGILSRLKVNEETLRKLIHNFSLCYINTGFGQLLDVISANRISEYNITENIPETISEMKTAYYTFVYPMLFGYLLTGKAEKEEIEKLQTLGKLAGIAFQYKDDIIGVFGGDAKTLNDLSEGKFTMLVKRTYELLDGDRKEIFRERISKSVKSSEDLNVLKKLIIESGSVESVKKDIEKLKHDSLDILETLSIRDDQKSYLREIISVVLKVEDIQLS